MLIQKDKLENFVETGPGTTNESKTYRNKNIMSTVYRMQAYQIYITL